MKNPVFKIHRYLFMFFSVVIATMGLTGTRTLPVMMAGADDFNTYHGEIESIRSTWESTSGLEGGYSRELVFDIRFAYQQEDVKRTSGTLSPHCDLCPYDDVVRIFGKAPGFISAGDAVKVYVLKTDPTRAFLERPSRGMFVRYIALLVVCIFVFPLIGIMNWRFSKRQEAIAEESCSEAGASSKW